MNIKKVLLTIISISLKMICIAIAIMAIYTVGIKAYDFGVKLFAETSVDEVPGTDVRITISKGMTSGDIADELAKKGFKNGQVYFSMSHSHEYAACSISNEPVGVDIEWIEKSPPYGVDFFICRDYNEKNKQEYKYGNGIRNVLWCFYWNSNWFNI